MNPAETLELAEQIKSLHELGLTILLIEHKLDVVTRLADTVFVLDHGEKIAEGTPDEVRRNEEVLRAYLGRAAHGGRRAMRAWRWRLSGDLLLEFNDVNTYYGDLHVAEGRQLRDRQGEIVSLLGGNACGKSTTMKTIMGVVRPTRGTVIFDGEPIEKLPTATASAAASRRCWRRGGCSRA